MGGNSRARSKLFTLKNKVSESVNSGLSVATAEMGDAVASLPAYDENGNLLGYIALYSDKDLT